MVTSQAAGKTILIVEDDAATRDALAIILGDEGYTVVGAANGQEAIRHLHSAAPPNLILLDLMMPVMDGWQFRRAQVQDPTLGSIPVVVLSADGDLQRKAASLAAADYLQKPVDLDSLLDSIRRHCREAMDS